MSKRIHFTWRYRGDTICGLSYIDEPWKSLDWAEVTCKNCLRHHREALAEARKGEAKV